MNWISIKDKLPDQGEVCFVYGMNDYIQNGGVNICLYDKGDFVPVDYCVNTYINVTHWMRIEKPEIE